MEPNANRLFWHEDSDGDFVEIIHRGHRVEQMTVGVGKKSSGGSRMAYLDRTAVEGLHAVLGRWLGLNEAPEQTGAATPADAPGPAQDTPGLRRSAMDMAIASGNPGVASTAYHIAMHLVHTLACPVLKGEACTCGGAVPGVPVPVLAPEHAVSAPECSLSEPVPATCSQCGHPEHDQGECAEHELQGGPRCTCIASKALRNMTELVNLACSKCGHGFHGTVGCGDPLCTCIASRPALNVPEAVLARCSFCGHDRHGAVGCGAGGRGIHRCGCRGIPQDGGQ